MRLHVPSRFFQQKLSKSKASRPSSERRQIYLNLDAHSRGIRQIMIEQHYINGYRDDSFRHPSIISLQCRRFVGVEYERRKELDYLDERIRLDN